jgi:hypothetical protein
MATHADRRVAMVEWRGPIILGRNDNLPMSIGESVLFIDDGANKSVRELIGPIVENRNALYDNAPFSIDVHPPVPGVIVIEYHRQAMRVEFKFLDIILCDEKLPLAASQNAVWIPFHLIPSEPTTITGPYHLDFGTLGIGSL